MHTNGLRTLRGGGCAPAKGKTKVNVGHVLICYRYLTLCDVMQCDFVWFIFGFGFGSALQHTSLSSDGCHCDCCCSLWWKEQYAVLNSPVSLRLLCMAQHKKPKANGTKKIDLLLPNWIAICAVIKRCDNIMWQWSPFLMVRLFAQLANYNNPSWRKDDFESDDYFLCNGKSECSQVVHLQSSKRQRFFPYSDYTIECAISSTGSHFDSWRTGKSMKTERFLTIWYETNYIHSW